MPAARRKAEVTGTGLNHAAGPASVAGRKLIHRSVGFAYLARSPIVFLNRIRVPRQEADASRLEALHRAATDLPDNPACHVPATLRAELDWRLKPPARISGKQAGELTCARGHSEYHRSVFPPLRPRIYALAFAAPAIRTHHVGLHPCFVDEDQSLSGDPTPIPLPTRSPARDVAPGLLGW